jgi:hypothetical protein
VSTLAIATPSTIFIVMVVLRFVVRRDIAVVRLILTLTTVIGNGDRAKRAAKLLKIYRNAPASGASGTKLSRRKIRQKQPRVECEHGDV